MSVERTTYPSGWDVQAGYYVGELQAKATEEADSRVVCLDHDTDGNWTVTAGHEGNDPEHVNTYSEYGQAARHFIDVLDDTGSFVRKSGIDVTHGDVYKTSDGPIQVKSIQSNGDVVVTDPTVQDPQDSRAGEWTISRFQLEDSLAREEIEPATIEVV